MKKTNLIAIAALAAMTVLASGCGGKDTPFTIDAGERSSSGDTTVTPVDSKTDVQGTATSGDDETIVPTGTAPDVVEATPPTPTPSTPTPPTTELPADRDEGVDDLPDIGTPPLPSGTIEIPAPGLLLPLPRGVFRIPADVFFSQHDQDVTHLMNDTFQPDEFTAYETQVQSRIVAERVALGEDFGIQLKNYVVEVLRKGIDAKRLQHEVFNQGVVKLGQVIAAFKSGDLLRSLNVVHDGVLSRRELFDAVGRHPDLLKQAGSYLEIQFAEAYKDIAKASFQANGEVSLYSTLVWGGDAFDLVYKPNGFLDQGFNHIHGLSDADIWHMGPSNWHAVAEGLRRALIAARPMDPAAAEAVARAIEEMSRQIREQGERITGAMGRW